MSESKSGKLLIRAYKFRWVLALLSVAAVIVLFRSGIGRVADFTSQVDSLADAPPKKTQPRMFDPRNDIWFDATLPALKTYHDIEARFVAQDSLFIAFTEPTDPHGVFSVKSLQAIDRLGKKIRAVPYVRNVRSLVANPWIRWEKNEDDEGLMVSDLFEKDAAEYTEDERLERMVSVLGAANAATLIGEERVRQIIGPNSNPEDFIGEPRLIDNVLSANGRSTAIVVDMIRPRFSDEKLDETFGAGTLSREAGPAVHASAVQIETLHAIQKLVAEEDGSIEYHVTGAPVMREHYMVTAKHDMKFVGLMIVVIGIVLLLIYRRVAGAVLPLATVFLAIMGMLGLIFVKGDLINLVTALTPQMLVAIGVATAVHLVSAYYRLRPDYTDKHELVRATFGHNLMPVFLTSLTTVVGFLSLTTSVISPIRQFGYSTAIGTVFAFVLSMVLVPTLLSLLPLKAVKAVEPKVDAKGKAKGHWSEALTRLVVRRRGLIIAAAAASTVIAVLGLYNINLTTELRTMFGQGNPVVADIFWVDKHISGTGDVELLFTGAPTTDTSVQAAERAARIAEIGNPTTDEYVRELASLKLADAEYRRGQIADSPEFLALLDKYQQRVETEAKDPKSPLNCVTAIDSGLSILRKIHQVQNENKGSFYRVPTDADIPEAARQSVTIYDDILEEETIIPGQTASSMISQYYLQFENSAKPEDNLSTLITLDRRMFRFTMRTRSLGSVHTLKAYARLLEIAHKEFPQLVGTAADVASGKAISTAQMTGSNYLQVHMVTAFSNTLIVSLSVAVLVITLLISVVFRSLILGLVSVIPNVLPIVVPLGFLSLIGHPLDGPSILVAAVGMGICVDDTIHFFHKFTQARAKGMGAQEAIQKTFKDIGSALTYTSIILACGFAMMTFATFRANVMIGLLGAVIIGLAWVADFIVTPALLSFLPAKVSAASSSKEVPSSDSTTRSKDNNEK